MLPRRCGIQGRYVKWPARDAMQGAAAETAWVSCTPGDTALREIASPVQCGPCWPQRARPPSSERLAVASDALPSNERTLPLSLLSAMPSDPAAVMRTDGDPARASASLIPLTYECGTVYTRFRATLNGGGGRMQSAFSMGEIPGSGRAHAPRCPHAWLRFLRPTKHRGCAFMSARPDIRVGQ